MLTSVMDPVHLYDSDQGGHKNPVKFFVIEYLLTFDIKPNIIAVNTCKIEEKVAFSSKILALYLGSSTSLVIKQ